MQSLLNLLIELANTPCSFKRNELIKKQPLDIQKAFLDRDVKNQNSLIRNILAGNEINFPDRDKVVTIER